MISLRGYLLLKIKSTKTRIQTFLSNYYLDFTSFKYSNIQFLSYSLRLQNSTITFKRYYLFSKYWTPLMIQINPATIPLHQPLKLGRRWGGDAWLKKQW